MCPTYDFSCPNGHTTEKRGGIETIEVPCPTCGKPAKREAVYADQCIFGDTCAKMYRRGVVPLTEKRFGPKLALMQEAASEIQYAAQKVKSETNQKANVPNYYQEGLRKAKRIKAGLEAPLKR